MKKILLTLATTLCGIAGFAQSSPEIHADNSVTFRLLAPQAAKVQVSGDWMPKAGQAVDMVMDSTGRWSHTTAVLPSELYSYNFIIDGVSTTDPDNVHQIRMVTSLSNIFIIKGHPGGLYSVNETPHGTMVRRWYRSPALNANRRIAVYTPAGYEQSKEKYPVLYLLHGRGGDEESWITLGRAAQLFDNLIAAGQAKPMIVVMPNGNVDQQAAPGESSDGLVKPNYQFPHTMDGLMEQSFPDIINFVETNYNVIKEKKGRAIAGLSMGGFHAKNISRQYPDMFDYVGLFSASMTPKQGVTSPVYDHPDEKLKVQFDKKPTLYWIAIGTDDFLYQANQEYTATLKQQGYPFTYRESSDGHVWKNWRLYLSEFASLLFR